ncbi:Outer membrane protein IcsA autotransporter precursor [compost metagenome]
MYQGVNGDVFITPQAQVIWSNMQANDLTEANGTRVQSDNDNNIQSRLGVKLSRDGVSSLDKGKDKLFTTYAEVNWLYNSSEARATLDGVAVNQAGSRNIGEAKLGLEGKLNPQAQIWGNVSQQVGGDGYSETAVMLGLKYTF